MCDYSLEHYQSRPARQGEDYVTNRFPSSSIGFVVPGDQSVAVCMTCDMRLRLKNIPVSLQTRLGVTASQVVTFTRLDAGLYRDGVRFGSGQIVSLQELGPGVIACLEDALAGPLPERKEERKPEPASYWRRDKVLVDAL